MSVIFCHIDIAYLVVNHHITNNIGDDQDLYKTRENANLFAPEINVTSFLRPLLT